MFPEDMLLLHRMGFDSNFRSCNRIIDNLAHTLHVPVS